MSVTTIQFIMSVAVPVMFFAALTWVILFAYLSYRRKTLNLTQAESATQSISKPSFLSTDQEARQAKLDGGEQFDQYIAERDQPEKRSRDESVEAPERCCVLAKALTVLFAIITLVTGAVGALMRVELYDETVRSLGVWSNLQAMIQAYPVGFAFAVCIVIVTGVNAMRMITSRR